MFLNSFSTQTWTTEGVSVEEKSFLENVLQNTFYSDTYFSSKVYD